MSFHEIRFPANLSFGSLGGPQRRTEIVTLQNGFEERNSPWAHARRHYDAGLGLRSLVDLEQLVAFFEARQGQLHGFRWKDWADYRSCPADRQVEALDQFLAYGDGHQTVFSLQKTYRSGAQSYSRPITKPVIGSVYVALAEMPLRESIDFEVDYARGELTFALAPALDAPVTAGFEFDVPVRFDTDQILLSVANFQAGEVPNIPVIEVRL